MADRWYRWNFTTKIFEYSDDYGGAWTPHGLDAANLTQGTIATARLGSGSASASKYLRGDQVWSQPASSELSDNNNLAKLNATNAFTGANSFATNPLNLLVGQIKFPASQNASSDSNTLDDYEEGTYTPVLTNITLGNGTLSGSYVKVGRLVCINVFLIIGTTTSYSAGNAWRFGLPFTVDATLGFQVTGIGIATDAGVGHYTFIVNAESSNVNCVLVQTGSSIPGGFTNTSPFTWNAGDYVRFTLVYPASA